MRLQDGMRAQPARSAWQFFPWWVAGCMGVVIVVNVFMAYSALHTFPGQAGRDGFDLSNRYDQVIDRVQRQAALGWTIDAATDDAGHPLLMLTDAAGHPLSGAAIQGVAERPVGATLSTPIAFREAGAGQYVGDAILPAKGQWDIMLTATADGHDVTTTRRIEAW
jgi:nitrogen fixation protein FixH